MTTAIDYLKSALTSLKRGKHAPDNEDAANIMADAIDDAFDEVEKALAVIEEVKDKL